ncbi:MAG TPA: hypothetical protein VHN36_21270 [Ilumatobacteraceae bacterium]|nr:hypothetical protein [Ilumatobacteraceae bacterium]
MAIDLGASYRAARLRIADLVDNDLADVRVPATPDWTVHDVVSHLLGVVTDVSTGNLEGVTTAPWTAAQVERCAGKTVAEVIEEWAGAAPGFESFLSSPAGSNASAAVMDVHCHETDVRAALGLGPAIPDDVLVWAGESMRTGFNAQVAAAGLPKITLDASDFELFRGRLGRRTRDEVTAFGWSADPAPYLDIFFIFGPTDHPVGS